MKIKTMLIAFALLGVGAFIFTVSTPESTTWLNIACGLWALGLLLIAFVLVPYIPDIGMRLPRSSRTYSAKAHPTAEVTYNGVIIRGSVFHLQNNMFRYVSGGEWIHNEDGTWLFKNKDVNPKELAEIINRNSESL